ncbi:MAG: class I SAM-dependent methyltransferase [Myxococcales bacterium]|nr:class I SAM-dependent methyltransferase [Myxococcales bacterium]
MVETIDEVLGVLRCPRTGSTLRRAGNRLLNDSGGGYAIREGVVDLVAEAPADVQAQMERSYDSVGGLRYDLLIKSRLAMWLLWGVDVGRLPKPAEEVAALPEGLVVDLPVGTGVFTVEAFKRRPDSIFLAMDYSMGMLRAAEHRARKAGVTNAVFIRADVARLPLRDAAVDAVVSLNGFHVFPEPERGAKELGRVLKKGGKFAATNVCVGERYLSDYIIERIMVPRGFVHHGRPVAAYRHMFEEAGLGDLDIQVRGALMFTRGTKVG